MEYRRLGNSGLKVSAVGLGANNFGWRIDEHTSTSIIDHALGLGINFIDTSNWYGYQGKSEEFVGKGIKGKRSQVIIATKFGQPMGNGVNERGCSRHHIMSAIDGSLKRLNTNYIDLYQIHVPDPTTPIEETLRTLDDLVRIGKVRYIGCSNFAAWQLCQALLTSRMNHLESFVTVQSEYNLLDRSIEQELVPCCLAYGVGVIPWGPLAGGLLTGKYGRSESPPSGSRITEVYGSIYEHLWSNSSFEKLAKLEAFTQESGHSLVDSAIAWLLSHPWVSTIIAGATKIEQVSANINASEWRLTQEDISRLDEITRIKYVR